MRFYVYAHIKKSNKEVFYIGKGSRDRMNSNNCRNKLWHNIVRKHGYFVEIIKDNLSEPESFELEIKLIKHYKELGLCQANLSLGGEGPTGLRHSAKTKKLLSSYKGAKGSMFGKKHTSASKLKMTIARTEGKIIEVYKAIKLKASGKGCTSYSKGEKVGEWLSCTQCALDLGLIKQKISRCLCGKRAMSGGYLFYYKPTASDKK
jgi:hypothetical protein